MTTQSQDPSASSPPRKPNFTSRYSVVVDQPLSTIYPVIAHGNLGEAVARISPLCSQFTLHEMDQVALPLSSSLADASVRTAPASSNSEVADGYRKLPRQAFYMEETVPVFLIYKTVVKINGTMTWDEEAKTALYESLTHNGITVWKLREFEELEEDGKKKTKISETVKGNCSPWLKYIVQTELEKSHRAHMNKYHTLFPVESSSD